MPSPTLAQGVEQCPLIVVARYQGYQASAKVDYFQGVTANYKVVRTLKGKADGRLTVRYDFQDGSACLADPNWKFQPTMMPEKGSTWILLLRSSEPASTYRGDFGRLKSTAENLKRIEALL